MKRLTSFWNDVTGTFYNPAFYSDVEKKPVGNAILFLLLVSIVSALASGIFLASSFAVSLKTFSADDFVTKNYPENLVVTVHEGKVSINQPEPYMIPVTESMKKDEPKYDNFLVIDTRPETTIETLDSYNSFAILTKDRIFFAPQEKDGRVFPLSSVKDVNVDKASTLEWTNILLGIFKLLLIPLGLIAILAVSVFSLVFHLIASLLGALLVMIVGMVRKHTLEYGQAYTVALYASVPVILVQTILMFFHVALLPYFLDLLLFIVVLFANLTPKNETSAQA